MKKPKFIRNMRMTTVGKVVEQGPSALLRLTSVSMNMALGPRASEAVEEAASVDGENPRTACCEALLGLQCLMGAAEWRERATRKCPKQLLPSAAGIIQGLPAEAAQQPEEGPQEMVDDLLEKIMALFETIEQLR